MCNMWLLLSPANFLTHYYFTIITVIAIHSSISRATIIIIIIIIVTYELLFFSFRALLNLLMIIISIERCQNRLINQLKIIMIYSHSLENLNIKN